MTYRIGIVTGIKNDVEMVEPFIEHHLKLGFTKIHLMDFNSTDGTKDILMRYQNHPQVEVELNPYNHGVPILQQQLRLRAYRDPDIDYLFYLDLDEFVVIAPNHSLESILDSHEHTCYHIKRFNILMPKSFASGISQQVLSHLHKLAYYTPSGNMSVGSFPIEPQKVWSQWLREQRLKGKVLHVKSSHGLQVNNAGHNIFGVDFQRIITPAHIFLAHIPVSSYARMKTKLRSYKNLLQTFSYMPTFIPRYTFITYAYQQGLSKQMYQEMFLDKQTVKEMLNMGLISRGENLLAKPTHIDPTTLLPFDRSFILNDKLASEIDG